MDRILTYCSIGDDYKFKWQQKLDLSRRGSWGEINPVTRKPTSSKAYNRKKAQDWKRREPPESCVFPVFLKIFAKPIDFPPCGRFIL